MTHKIANPISAMEKSSISQHWSSFCDSVHKLVAAKTFSKYKGISGSVLLFVGDSQQSIHTLAVQLDMDPSSLTKVVEYLEDTCLPNLILLFEGFRHYITELGQEECAEALKKVMMDCGYGMVEEISEPGKNVDEETEVVNIGDKSYLEEINSLPADVVVDVVKEEVDSCSSNDTSPEDNENIKTNVKPSEANQKGLGSHSAPNYHCQVCYRPFHRLWALQAHKEKKHKMGEDAKFRCQLCGHGFHLLPSLTTHIRRKHSEKKKNLCQYCGKYFEDYAECRKHIRWHLSERRNSRSVVKDAGQDTESVKQIFHCELCGTKFSLVGRLQTHIIRKHYDEMDSICMYCGKHFTDPVKYHAHLCDLSQREKKQTSNTDKCGRSQYKKHTEYKCEICASTFLRRSALQTHIIEAHYVEKDRMCGHCGKFFETMSECRKHVHTHYKDRKAQQVEISQKDIVTNSDEKNEIVKETTERPMINVDSTTDPNIELHCHLCNRRFYTLCSLQRHILRNHHDEKDRLCRYCGQLFDSVDDCSNHVRIHKAENRRSREVFKQPIGLVNGKYSCQLCGRTFRLAATLRCHRLRAHPLEKERLCPRCGKYFDTEEACNKHRRLHVEKNVLSKNKARTMSNIITGPKHIKCHLCGENFYVRGGIGNHIQRKHTEKRHCLCRYCGRYFQTPDECRTHVRLHVIERRQIRDSYQERKQPTPNQRISNQKREKMKDATRGSNQEENKPVQCQVCCREYKLLSSFRRHISQYHPEMQDRLCHHCSLLLEDSDACKQHLETVHSQNQQKEQGNENLHSQLDQVQLEDDDVSFQGNGDSALEEKSMSLSEEASSSIPPGYMKCGLCPSILGSRSSMRDHIKSKHSKVQEHMCACCGKFFDDPTDCLEHQQPSKRVVCETESTTEIPPGYIKCGLCTSVLGSRKSMRDHIRSLHFKEKNHMCACCGKYFSTPAERDQHQRPQANLTCDFCPREFKTQFARDGHMKRHKNQRDFQCDICGNCYFDKKGLNAHRERHDSQAKGMFQCSQCEKVLSSKKNLEIHMRIHNNERPFVCEICGKGFTLISTMKIHRNIHSGIKPYECETCGKKARTKGDLGRHMSLHSDKKEFVCDICGKSYRFQTGLNQHRAVHSGLRPHICKLCGCTYKTSNDLRKHMKTHRPGAKSKGTTVPRVPVSGISSNHDSLSMYNNAPMAQPQPLPPPPPQPQQQVMHPPPREPMHPHPGLSHTTDSMALMAPHRTNTTYTNEDMAVVMALQVLDDISVAEQGAYGVPPQTMRRYDPNVANYPPPPAIRRYDGSIANYPGHSNFRRYDGSAPNYP